MQGGRTRACSLEDGLLKPRGPAIPIRGVYGHTAGDVGQREEKTGVGVIHGPEFGDKYEPYARPPSPESPSTVQHETIVDLNDCNSNPPHFLSFAAISTSLLTALPCNILVSTLFEMRLGPASIQPRKWGPPVSPLRIMLSV